MSEANVSELISNVVRARKCTPTVIAKYCENMSDVYIKHLQSCRCVTDKLENVEIVWPENPLEHTEINLEKKTGVDKPIKKMQEQIKLMDLLVRIKQCPINQIIDKL